jgi:endo-1,4-beta-xylanase
MNQNFRKGMKVLSLGIGFSAAIMLLFASCSKETVTKDKVSTGSYTSGYTQDSSNLKSTGSDHGYFWQCYVSSGSGSITFPSAGTYAGNFAVSWSNIGDIVAGKGWNPGSNRTINYNCGALSGQYKNFGVYGWTTNPLIEYYVCEMGSVASGSAINSISSDGHTYTFYKHQQVNQPSITGTATFWQYLDNWGGSSTGSTHAVTLGNHINNWKSRGGQGFGSFNLQILAVEDWGGGSGYCNATVW